jgi:hypothetical protein
MSVPASDPLTGAALYADVVRYAGFGVHRYGSPGERAAIDWIATELEQAGLAVADQPLSMPRQFVLEQASVCVGARRLEAFPHWWMPEAHTRLELRAPLKAPSQAAGALAWVALPHDRASYLNDGHRRAILAAAAHRPAAILLTIDNPAGEIFTYNVDQATEPWPVPVIVLASKHAALLQAAQRSGEPLAVSVSGRYQRDVPGRNVIGRLGAGAAGPTGRAAAGAVTGTVARTIVVSTPVSSWFVSACERGPGIATFLALARHVARTRPDAGFVFVATVGHEIGHGGMEQFIAHAAPAPADVTAWVHLGASNACYGWVRDGDRVGGNADVDGDPDGRGDGDRDGTVAGLRSTGRVDADVRILALSPSLEPLVHDVFADVAAHRFTGERAGVGELREVRAAGYPNFFGMAGMHRFFHTPRDAATMTGPEILEPVARAFARAVDRLAAPPR